MPYTYLIGWTKLNMWYYGVRYAKNCDPSDLWVDYFTSSNYVKEFRAVNGEPDVIEIRRIFKDSKYAIRCEDRVIRNLKIYSNSNFLNKSYSGSIFYSEEVRKKISDSAKGRKAPHLKNKTPEHIEKMRLTKTGVKQTPEQREATSLALKKKYAEEVHHSTGTTLSEDHRMNISIGIRNSQKFKDSVDKMKHTGSDNGMFGKRHSDETREKIRQKRLEYYKNKKMDKE